MVAVSSSMIKDVTYNGGSSELFVTFSNGSKYKYSDVPEDVYDSVVNASSPGRTFIAMVKDSFDGVQI